MRDGADHPHQGRAEKKRARQEAAAGYLQEWGAAVERADSAPGPICRGEMCVADLKLFVAAGRI